jgi:uncharacterized membrane protein
MVDASATIIALLGIAIIFFWISFQLSERHDILKGLLLVTGLIMLLIMVSMIAPFIKTEAELYGYDSTNSYTTLMNHANISFKVFIYLIYVILGYVIIYYVFFIITPKIMDWAMNIGLVKKSRKKRIEETKEEESGKE